MPQFGEEVIPSSPKGLRGVMWNGIHSNKSGHSVLTDRRSLRLSYVH